LTKTEIYVNTKYGGHTKYCWYGALFSGIALLLTRKQRACTEVTGCIDKPQNMLIASEDTVPPPSHASARIPMHASKYTNHPNPHHQQESPSAPHPDRICQLDKAHASSTGCPPLSQLLPTISQGIEVGHYG